MSNDKDTVILLGAETPGNNETPGAGTLAAIQDQIKSAEWSVEYHEQKLRDARILLKALKATAYHIETYGDAE